MPEHKWLGDDHHYKLRKELAMSWKDLLEKDDIGDEGSVIITREESLGSSVDPFQAFENMVKERCASRGIVMNLELLSGMESVEIRWSTVTTMTPKGKDDE